MNRAAKFDLGAEAVSILRDELGVEPIERNGLLFLRCRICGNEWNPYPGLSEFGRFVGTVSSKQLVCIKCCERKTASAGKLCMKGESAR